MLAPCGWAGRCPHGSVDHLSSPLLSSGHRHSHSSLSSVPMPRASHARGCQWRAGCWKTAWFSAKNPGFESHRPRSPSGLGQLGTRVTRSAFSPRARLCTASSDGARYCENEARERVCSAERVPDTWTHRGCVLAALGPCGRDPRKAIVIGNVAVWSGGAPWWGELWARWRCTHLLTPSVHPFSTCLLSTYSVQAACWVPGRRW